MAVKVHSKGYSMNSKVLLIRSKMFLMICIMGLGWVFSGCAPAVLTPVSASHPAEQPADRPDEPGQTETMETTPEKQSPRALAALQLTDQGRMFLEQGRPDDAIGIFERALNLNPNSGMNYYYLSEAWLMKGNIAQAAEFNRLAEIYFKDDNLWLDRLMEQRERIKNQKPQ
jgi:tetratricopeptide (TPR) repeat protein